MSTQTPTGVFVRLPLSDEQREAFIVSVDCGEEVEASILSIGTPVTHEELYPVGYINEDAIGGLQTGIYQSASIFRDEDKEHHDTVALVRLDVAQAKLAERDAEIARLRDALLEAKTFHEDQDKAISKQPPSAQGQWRRNQHQEQVENIEAALKGTEA